MNRFNCYLLVFCGILLCQAMVNADNPLILDQFSADPTARVFDGKIYVYPSHDIPASPGRGRSGWFVMEDYHVFSSENLMDWTDHGVILTQTQVPWLGRESFDMWAPDCVFKNGKYYFYYPTGGRIGVAIADKPYGPFKPEQKAIEGVRGIDPGILIDKDGSVYMFWSGISMAKLKDNMVELDSQPQQVQNLPRPGLIEGPFPFERNGIYYLTYPHVQNKTERLEYSTATNPMGPYEWKGVIMDESASGCWTNHHSILEYKGQWYLFYHDKDLSPDFDKNRAIRADYLTFNADGTIQKVIPTLRGIGIADATKPVQVDRYSAVSSEKVSVAFVDAQDKKKGWKVLMAGSGDWVQYNDVEFGRKTLKSVKVRTVAKTGGAVDIRIDKADGPVVAQVTIPEKNDWDTLSSKVLESPAGIHKLFVVTKDAKAVEIDWVQFE